MKKLPLLLALTLTVVLVGQALLSTRATFVAKNNSSGVPKSRHQMPKGGPTEAQPLVDMRGQGAIDPKQVFEAESESGLEERKGATGESEAERAREKGRYAFVGRMAAQSGDTDSNGL